jgi:pSer/pThr/pTyr-binding forkhead associated (FHA) protein
MQLMDQLVVLYLLDSEQGHPLQYWSFEGEPLINIGRAADNDIVFPHPGVSRSHAYVRFDGGAWTVFSISQQGIYYGPHKLMELRLQPGMVFRLGSSGPCLRFGAAEQESDEPTTLALNGDQRPILTLDHQKLLNDVTKVTEDDAFQRVMTALKQLRGSKADEPPATE